MQVMDMPIAPSVPERRQGVCRMRMDGLSKAFDGHAAIEGVSFEVHDGEFVAVLGPSGAGKTTLFRCMTGLLPSDDGSVWIDNDDIAAMRDRSRRRLAVVFQQFNLVNRLTALENVLAGRLGYLPAWRGWLRRFTRADRLLALECLDRVGLLAQAAQRTDTLSGGQQQRVAIARALAQQPSLIVADEPVVSLDPNASASVLELLRGIARTDGVGVICSLHQVHFARAYADRIIGLSRGRIVIDVPSAKFDQAAFESLYGFQDSATPEPIVV